MKFFIDKISNNARATTIITSNSTIKTPVFMPVGTVGSVKSLDANDMQDLLDAKIILANTYHLYLRPTQNVIKELGGLRGFSKFNKSFLTDSGGFQAFSMGSSSKADDEGIAFKSHIDGKSHYFTPKKVIDIQYDFSSDIMMVLDDLIALPATSKRLEKSVLRTTRWAKESIEYHKQKQAQKEYLDRNLFAIIQGGTDKQFRKLSAKSLTELEDFDGYAIGGLSVGEENQQMYDTVEYTTQFMPKNRPRYLMGVGTPEDLIENIDRGVDMFDCVMPTRNARNGTIFTSFGKINIKSHKFKLDNNPIDSSCNCYTCKNYSRAYLCHLFRSKEITYYRLASMHNLYYYLELMKEARSAILDDRWSEFKSEFYGKREMKI